MTAAATTPNRARRTCLRAIAAGGWLTGLGSVGLIGLVKGAQAADTVPPPPDLAQSLPGARLQGQVRYRWFGIAIYDARLWGRERVGADDYAQHEFVLELQYARNLGGADIAERSLGEMRKVGAFTDAQGAAWLAAMKAVFPDVHPGDRLTGWHRPGQGVAFHHNGKPAGSVADPAFAPLFFGIWLSPRNGEAALRASLLGLAP
ncbi:MAG: chalcone isomerase family protein [Leptothrix sp. (in: b-proteobacteria)]